MICSKVRKNGRNCMIDADRCVDGVWYCHMHDPTGIYQRQRSGKIKALNHPETKDLNGDSYIERNKTLRQIGFSSYAEYLDSDLWRHIRRKVFRSKGRRCCICDEPAQHIHHSRYAVEDLMGTKHDHLWPLCPTCHRGIEFDDSGKKRMLDEVSAVFTRLCPAFRDAPVLARRPRYVPCSKCGRVQRKKTCKACFRKRASQDKSGVLPLSRRKRVANAVAANKSESRNLG